MLGPMLNTKMIMATPLSWRQPPAGMLVRVHVHVLVCVRVWGEGDFHIRQNLYLERGSLWANE